MDTVAPRTVKDRIEEARFDGIFVLRTNAKVPPLLKALGIARPPRLQATGPPAVAAAAPMPRACRGRPRRSATCT